MEPPWLRVGTPPGYKLEAAAPSYGFFMFAPNRWDPAAGSLTRPLTLHPGGAAVTVTITQDGGAGGDLVVKGAGALGDALSRQQVVAQVVRMLRLGDKDQAVVAIFHQRVPQAEEEGFGWLFRSPTMWEDICKSISLCNCGFGRSLTMNSLLCDLVGTGGAFPTPAEVAAFGVDRLQRECGLGYRAKSLAKLAGILIDGSADLGTLEGEEDEGELMAGLLALPGVGPFVARNVLMALGRYGRIPCDTETARHLQQVHRVPASKCDSKGLDAAAERVYGAHGQVAFLVYWHELWRGYEKAFGAVAKMAPGDYANCTGARMAKAAATPEKAGAASPAGGGGGQRPAAAAAASAAAPGKKRKGSVPPKESGSARARPEGGSKGGGRGADPPAGAGGDSGKKRRPQRDVPGGGGGGEGGGAVRRSARLQA